MAFHGDIASYPLPDLLQWLDGTRKSGALHLVGEGGERKLFLEEGVVVATSSAGQWERLARVMEHGEEAKGAAVLLALRSHALDGALASAVRQLAEEEILGALIDFTATPTGRFHWSEDGDRGDDEWVQLELPVRHLLLEALRRLDELADVNRALAGDGLVVRAKPGPLPSQALARVVVRCAARTGGTSIGRLWIQLGLARSLVARAVYELWRQGKVEVEGAAELEADPVADMLEKGAVLLREYQFDAAQLVFTALLQKDPSDRRVRDFVRMVEREHVASLYRELPPMTTFEVPKEHPGRTSLRPEERQLLAWMEAGFDVSALVLASPQRELETLKAMGRFVRAGLASPRLA
jgi:hypothetical protein